MESERDPSPLCKYERESKSMISICYSGNKRVFPGLLLSVLSLTKYTERALRIYVLSMDLHEENPLYLPFSENQMRILNEVLQKKNAESRAELIDMTQIYKESLAAGKNKKNHYTPYAQLRLYLNELECIPDKIIYLDIDTMCTGDIGQLFDIDISDYEYAAALDYMGKFWIDRHYCNSGVLLLNMREIRKTDLFRRLREFVLTRRMIMPDQSALHRLGKRRMYLPRRFNEQRDIRDDTVIKHFCRGIRWLPFFHIYDIKQWEREKVHKSLKIAFFDDLYEEYDRLAERCDLER